MKLDKSIAVLAMVASLVLAAGAVAAQDNEPADADTEFDILDQYAFESSDELDVEGGNITQANLTSEQSTDDWAGVFGNASGELILGANGVGGDVLYDWDASADYVFAASEAVEWTEIVNGSAEAVNDYYDNLDQQQSDDAIATFDDGVQEVTVAREQYEGDSVNTYDENENAVWPTVVVEDNSTAADETESGTPVFSSETLDGETAFNGDEADYQMLLPAENGDTEVSSFDMYLELS